MALTAPHNRFVRQRYLPRNNPGGDAVIFEARQRDADGWSSLVVPRIEMGQGDGLLMQPYSANIGMFSQIMRQIALDFSLLEFHVRTKIVEKEEFRLQEKLLEEAIKASGTVLLSTIVWLICYIISPRIFMTPLLPIYTIACIAQCFIGRLIWNYQVDDAIKRRMEPVQDHLRAERAHLTRMVENMVFGVEQI